MFSRLLLTAFAVLFFWCRLNSSSCNYLSYMNSTSPVGHCAGSNFSNGIGGWSVSSSMFACNSAGNMVTYTMYSTIDCTGTVSQTTIYNSGNSTFHCGGSDCYVSGKLHVYYGSATCAAAAYYGWQDIIAVVDTCLFGDKVTCTSTSGTDMTYSKSDCSGTVTHMQVFDSTCRNINGTVIYYTASDIMCMGSASMQSVSFAFLALLLAFVSL